MFIVKVKDSVWLLMLRAFQTRFRHHHVQFMNLIDGLLLMVERLLRVVSQR